MIPDEKLDKCGEFLRDVDGFYYFWPVEKGGCYSEYLLDSISARLKRMNAEWNEIINNDPALNSPP